MNKVIKFALMIGVTTISAPMEVDEITANPKQAYDTINDLERRIRDMQTQIERLTLPELNPAQMEELQIEQAALDDELRTEEMSLEGIALRYPELLHPGRAVGGAWPIPSSTAAPSIPGAEHPANTSIASSVISAQAPSTVHTQPGPVPQPLSSRTLAVDNDPLRRLVAQEITTRATNIVTTYDQLLKMHEGGGIGERERVTNLLVNYKSLLRRFIRYSESYYLYDESRPNEWWLVRKIQDYLISSMRMPLTLTPFMKKFNVNMQIFNVIRQYINRQYPTFDAFDEAARAAMQ